MGKGGEAAVNQEEFAQGGNNPKRLAGERLGGGGAPKTEKRRRTDLVRNQTKQMIKGCAVSSWKSGSPCHAATARRDMRGKGRRSAAACEICSVLAPMRGGEEKSAYQNRWSLLMILQTSL